MSSPRFYVCSVTGYSERAGGVKQSTSYSVLDTLYNCREVARFYVSRTAGESDAARLKKATAECDRLNEWAASA